MLIAQVISLYQTTGMFEMDRSSTCHCLPHYGPHFGWITLTYLGNFPIHWVFWWILGETLSGEFPKATPVEFISPASWIKFTRTKNKKKKMDYIQPLICWQSLHFVICLQHCKEVMERVYILQAHWYTVIATRLSIYPTFLEAAIAAIPPGSAGSARRRVALSMTTTNANQLRNWKPETITIQICK